MITQNINSTDFRGKLIIRNYSKKGAETTKFYTTNYEQDKLIQITADKYSPRNWLSNNLTIEGARVFKTLLEMIIKKPLKETNQRKIMSNTDNAVVFSDAQPGDNGFLATLIYEN